MKTGSATPLENRPYSNLSREFFVPQSRLDIMSWEKKQWEKEELITIIDVLVTINNMIFSLVASEQCNVIEEEDIIDKIYKGYLDGACGAGGEDGSECVEAGKFSSQGEMESIESDKTSLLERFMIEEFIRQGGPNPRLLNGIWCKGLQDWNENGGKQDEIK